MKQGEIKKKPKPKAARKKPLKAKTRPPRQQLQLPAAWER